MRLGRRAILAGLLPALPAVAKPARPMLRLATGPRGSAFASWAEALCAAVPEDAALALAQRQTLGSVENLHLLEQGQVPLACTFLETAQAALAGRAGFAGRPLRRLRALMPLYGLPCRLLTRPGLALTEWRGLAGRRVAVGQPGGLAEAMMQALATTLALAAPPEAVPGAPLEQAQALAEGRLDALLLVGGAPRPGHGGLGEVPMAAEEAAAIRTALPWLGPATWPGAEGQRMPGLASWSLVVAQAGLSEAWAATVVRLALAESARLRAALPAEVVASPDPAALQGLDWHSGGLTALAEAGWTLPG